MTWEQVVAEGLLGTSPQSCLRQFLQLASTRLLAPPPRVLVAQLQPQGGTRWGARESAAARAAAATEAAWAAVAILMQLELVLSRLMLLEECVRPLLVDAPALPLAQVLSRLIAHAGEEELSDTCWLGTWLCRGRWRTHANASTPDHEVPTH